MPFTNINKVLVFLLIIIFIPQLGFGSTTKSGLPLPRFVTFKSQETNLRSGPGANHPIKWTYKIRGYPVEVITEYENWRQVRDIEGITGWVHQNLLTKNRAVIVLSKKAKGKLPSNEELLLLRYDSENSRPVARLEAGAIIKLERCKQEWCKVSISGITGWLRKENIWGVYSEELFK
jgi:SH3-like domain-containing protein